MSTFDEFMVRASAGAPPLEQAHKNALSKQYNLVARLTATESIGDKPFFDSGPVTWYGIDYGFLVAIQHELLEILQKTNQLGGVIAVGEVPPVPPAK